MSEKSPTPSAESGEKESAEARRLRRRIEGLVPNVLKKTVNMAGETAHFTEDVLRSVVGDLKLPKEAVTYLLALADNTKKEVVRVAAREVREFLESANLADELTRILTSMSFEIRTEVRFVPNDASISKAKVSSEVRVKSDGSAEEPARSEGGAGATLLSATGLGEVVDEVVRQGALEVLDILRRRKDAEVEESAEDDERGATETEG